MLGSLIQPLTLFLMIDVQSDKGRENAPGPAVKDPHLGLSEAGSSYCSLRRDQAPSVSIATVLGH